VETFVVRFAPNVTRGGIFLATRTPRPTGEVFNFEVQLSTGRIALAGEGKVIWVKDFDPKAPQKPHGMGVQFVHMDPGSRDMLNRILRAKTSPHAPLDPTVRGGRNGSRPYPLVVDSSVDLAAEYNIDEATLRRAVDHRWMVNGPADAELDDLLKDDDTPVETITLAQALAELPRLLDPTGSRRRSGAYRSLEITNSGNTTPEVSRDAAPEPERTGPITERMHPVITDEQAAEILDPHGTQGSAR
jgi:uncharacterized protein (TIGR02266 family)